MSDEQGLLDGQRLLGVVFARYQKNVVHVEEEEDGVVVVKRQDSPLTCLSPNTFKELRKALAVRVMGLG